MEVIMGTAQEGNSTRVGHTRASLGRERKRG